jgi:hypothetical protein
VPADEALGPEPPALRRGGGGVKGGGGFTARVGVRVRPQCVAKECAGMYLISVNQYLQELIVTVYRQWWHNDQYVNLYSER